MRVDVTILNDKYFHYYMDKLNLTVMNQDKSIKIVYKEKLL